MNSRSAPLLQHHSVAVDTHRVPNRFACQALASRNRSGLLGDFPLPRFGRAGDQNDRNNGPYANKQPWEQRLDRFNFEVQQAEAKAADPNHNTQSWSPPGNRWYASRPSLSMAVSGSRTTG